MILLTELLVPLQSSLIFQKNLQPETRSIFENECTGVVWSLVVASPFSLLQTRRLRQQNINLNLLRYMPFAKWLSHVTHVPANASNKNNHAQKQIIQSPIISIVAPCPAKTCSARSTNTACHAHAIAVLNSGDNSEANAHDPRYQLAPVQIAHSNFRVLAQKNGINNGVHSICNVSAFWRECWRLPYKRLRCSSPYHSQSFPVSLLLSIPATQRALPSASKDPRATS